MYCFSFSTLALCVEQSFTFVCDCEGMCVSQCALCSVPLVCYFSNLLGIVYQFANHMLPLTQILVQAPSPQVLRRIFHWSSSTSSQNRKKQQQWMLQTTVYTQHYRLFGNHMVFNTCWCHFYSWLEYSVKVEACFCWSFFGSRRINRPSTSTKRQSTVYNISLTFVQYCFT